MAWCRSETLKTYEHYFDFLHHARLQDRLHAKWYQEDCSYEKTSVLRASLLGATTAGTPSQDGLLSEDEHTWETLLALGGDVHV